MSKRDWKLFVEDLLESIHWIENYAQNMDFESFAKDRKTVDAVVRNFEIIGEAAKYVPEEVKNTFREVDWKGIVGLRNRIAHEYFGVSAMIIWHIVTNELPKLKDQMETILKKSVSSL